MFQLIRETHFGFMRVRRRAYAFSGALMLAGLVSVLLHGGFRLGIDFTGGRLFEYRFDRPVAASEIRSVLGEIGVDGGEVQDAGNAGRDFMVRLPVTAGEVSAGEAGPSIQLLQELQKRTPGLQGEILREELVGPRVGRELRSKAFWAVLIALGLIAGYVAVRFDIKFSTGGVVALAHDVLAVLVAFSLFNREISIPVIAALLTIGGFSINDTVVVFDRIREQSRLRIGQKLSEVIDIAVNQTLSRTIITSLTVLMTALALLFFGGEVLFDFALAMTVGLLSGSYSTVFVASAIALDFNPEARIEAPPAATGA